MEIQVCKVANYVDIEKLKFHPLNKELRTITRGRLEDLKESILEKGFYEPILVWKKGGIVLSGEHRVKACLELIEEGHLFKTPNGKPNHLPVVIEDVDDDTAYAILHEANNHYATWVEETLSKALLEAEEAGKSVKSFGYSEYEIDKYIERAMENVDMANLVEPKSQVSDSYNDDDYSPPVQRKEFGSIVLPLEVHANLYEIITKMARMIKPNWGETDSIVPAVEALCELIRETGILNEQ